MRFQPVSLTFPVVMLAAALLLSACSAPTPPAAQPTPAPTSAIVTQAPARTALATVGSGPAVDPASIVDLDEFKAALLKALMDQDVETLQRVMTEPFLEGGWRADASDTAPVDGLRNLYTNYLGTQNRVELVKDADLKALMGGRDPLFLPRAEAGVIDAALVSGWGKDGRDEAVLYIARAADNTLKWHGWIVIPGGFSGARLGGIQHYVNQNNAFSVFLPKDYEILETNPDSILVMAPGEGHPGQGRAAAFINIEPANGRTVDEVVEQVKADAGPGFNIPPYTALGLDKAMALVVSGLPGEDVNRQLFAVYKDRLIHITFVPDTPKVGAPYWQMEDLYAMIVNTFHFTD